MAQVRGNRCLIQQKAKTVDNFRGEDIATNISERDPTQNFTKGLKQVQL